MRTKSIFFSITLLFVLALSGFVAVCVYYIKTEPELQSLRQYNSILRAVDSMIVHRISLDDVKKYLKILDFMEIEGEEKDLIASLIPRDINPPPGSANISVERFKNNVFIYIKTHDDFLLYKDSISVTWSTSHIIMLIAGLVFVFTYMVIIKKLAPLQKLKQEIKGIIKSGEVKEISYKFNNQDEIGELYNEFNQAMRIIASFSKARSLFLRSIMHELKTPIAKGRIVAEMVGNEKQKDRLVSVFDRLNNLINDFARLEEITSKHYNLRKTEFLLTDLIDKVYKMLLIDKNNNNIELIHNDDLIKGDFGLFSLSVKNLIDNAIKYSSDSKAIIQADNRDLHIKNKGNPLKLKLEDYFEPFSKYNKNPNSHGFGLGMYIIKNSLEAQHMNISYSYIDGYNIFSIHDCIVESFCVLPKY